MTPLKWFSGFLKKYRLAIVIGLVLMTVIVACAIVNPYISGMIVDDVIQGGAYDLLPKLIGIMLAVTAVRAILRYATQMMFETCSQGVLYRMRDAVYRKLLQEDFAFYNRNRTGDLMSRQTGDMDAIRHFVAFVIYTVYENILMFIFALVMIFMVNVKLALCMMAVLPFCLFTTYLQSKHVKPRFHECRQSFSSLNAFVQENISGNRVVKAFAKEEYEKEKFEKDKANWEISAKAVKGTATTVPTTDLKKVTDAYNSSYAAVESAVKAYNSAWDAVYQAAYDDAVEKEKASVLEKTYRDNMITALSPTSKAAWEALTPAEQTTSKLEAILDDTVKQAKAKADANATLAEWLKLDQTVADLAAKGEAAGNQALADDKDKKVEKAKAALVEAAGKAATAVAKVAPAISTYSALAANPYGQILANTVSVEDMTGKDAFYKEEEKDGKKTGHMQALRSDISADEFTKLSATKLDRNTAEDALEYTSDATFGTVIPGEDRLVEVTEAMVRAYIKQNNSAVLTDFGTLGAMMAANDDVQTCKDMIAAADLIKPLKAQMEGVLADLNAEINTNTALMDPFIAKADETRIALKTAKEEVKKAQEEQDALTAEAEANSKKFAELIQDYDGLISVVQDQIDGINGGVVTGTVVTVESVLNYWKNEVATQEKSVEEAKQKVTAAEKSIELFNKGEYKEAYVIEQKKLALETAQEAYDVAKAIYDTALAQVKAVLETLSK